MASPSERRGIDLGTDELIYEVDGTVAWLTFNRPHARNAMTWAMYDGLCAACERVDADEGKAVGLFSEVVEADRLESRTRELATRIAGHAPLTLRSIKEGVAAFLEKRAPQWTGR